MEIKLTDKNKSLEKLLKQLEEVTSRSTKQKFYNKASFTMHENVIRHFEKEQGPDGKWKKFAWPDGSKDNAKRLPWYINGRKQPAGSKVVWKDGKVSSIKGNTGNKVLQRTGHLRQSIVPASDTFGAKVQTDVGYAGFLNEGTSRMPQREFMYIDDTTINMIMDDIVETIMQDLNK